MSLKEAIRRGQNALQDLETKRNDGEEDDTSQGGFFSGAQSLVAFLYPFVVLISPFLALGGLGYFIMWLLPSKDTVMTRAENARVEQLEHVTSQERDIQHHDERRDVALQAVQDLRMALQTGRAEGQERNYLVGPELVASSLLTQLLQGVHIHGIKFQELNEKYQESENRLKLIEQGQTAIASMNDQDAWIYIAQNAEKIKKEQEEKSSKNDDKSNDCCVIM